ncbi:MAG: DUF1638 domain-containing protein [Terrimicrobiaceae bacterium]|nr:DUF1638 domain-containing protein [Terrimicrobiaceae bacterium]
MRDQPRIGLIACRVFEEEIALHGGGAPHILETRFLEVGLHDQPGNLRKAVQAEIDAFDGRGDIDAVVLAYALCGRGTAGLRAGRHRLVIPRGHDCMTVFMGSKEKFACQQAACPDSYYYTPGWMKANRTPGPDRLEALRAEFSEKFDPDDVEFLVESEKANWAQHGRAVYLDLGTPGADEKAAKAEASAKALGWEFERMPGDSSLLEDLLSGRWDPERFQIIEPGGMLDHAPDEKIFRARP